MRFLVVLLMVSGCALGQSPFSSGAAKDVRRSAQDAGRTMSTLDRAKTADAHANAVLREGSVVVALVDAHGDGYDGHVVLRISSDHAASSTGVASTAEACFRYDLGGRSPAVPAEVDC